MFFSKWMENLIGIRVKKRSKKTFEDKHKTNELKKNQANLDEFSKPRLILYSHKPFNSKPRLN